MSRALPTEVTTSTKVAASRKWEWRFGALGRLRGGVPNGLPSQVAELTPLASTMKKVRFFELGVGRPTWKSAGKALGTDGGTTSIRPSEDLNPTLAQFDLAPLSKQTAFQFDATKLLRTSEHLLFDPEGEMARDTALYVIPRSAEIIGAAADKTRQVVELTYSLGVKFERHTLPPGEYGFFGEGADNSAGFAKLGGDLKYSKLFKEIKAYPTSGVLPLAKFLPFVIRADYRPELLGERTISRGKIVSQQFLQQNQATLGGIRLKTQFIVDPDVPLNEFLKHPTVPAIHAMVANDKIRVRDVESLQLDSKRVHSYVPGRGVMGNGSFRTSVVSGGSAFVPMTDLTGRTTDRLNPEFLRLDISFPDRFRLSGFAWFDHAANLAIAPDWWLSQAAHWVNRKVKVAMPESLQRGLGYIGGKLPPLPQFVPTRGVPLLEAMTGPGNEFATMATRYTVAVGTPAPPIPYFKVVDVGAELRGQAESSEQSVAPAIKNQNDPLDTVRWLRSGISWSRHTHSHLVVPKGGYEALNHLLGDLGKSQGAEAAVEDFRAGLLPSFRESTKDNPNPAYTGFVSPDEYDAIDAFLKQVEPKPGENV